MSEAGPSLLILAAGMGSRFGGLKQVEPVGPSDESILEYSIYDAIEAGFTKAVFVIRREFEEAFRERFIQPLADRIETAIVFQELDSCVEIQPALADREKPWGTGHAVLVSQQAIQEPFAVINADDFYGRGAYRSIANHLQSISSPSGSDSSENPDTACADYALVGYPLRNTLSDFGTVCRGKCDLDQESYLTKVTELRTISKQNDGAVYLDDSEGGQPVEKELTGAEAVSMNLWGFGPKVYGQLQRLFNDFVQKTPDPGQEFELPTSIDHLIQSHKARVKVLPTDERWFGLTYQEDRELARARIAKLVTQGVYPERLWSNP